MATLTLRPWPFPENQEVELVWFGSPFLDYKNNWRVRVAFRTILGVLKIVSYPWGTIPYLRVGHIYTNGIHDPIRVFDGTVFHFSIDRLNQGEIVNGFKLPKRLIDFGKNPELGLQKVIQFKSTGITFCIPIIELIRVMFINSKYLAYHLLQPHGLDLLVDKSELHERVLYFDLNKGVPTNLANEITARHLSWIYMDPEIRSIWDSVYQLMFSDAIKESPQNPTAKLKKGIPLNVELPAIELIKMNVRGEQFIDYVLVKEIIAISGFKHPADEIVFWHPSKKRRETSSGEKQVHLIPGSKKEDYILNDQSENSKEDANQDVLEAAPIIMKFQNNPPVKTRREDVINSQTGNGIVIASSRGGKYLKEAAEVSTQDSIVGGDTRPIEFQTFETISVKDSIGLELFFEMIQFLKRIVPLNLRMSVLLVPPGKQFSICPNGTRRACAIVQVTNGKTTRYIIEVARPDDWSISTLILYPIKQIVITDIERNIKFLLNGLVQKGGHWDQFDLDRNSEISIEKVKHYQSDTIRKWAYRIARKLTY